MSDIQQKLWDAADDETIESLRQQLANSQKQVTLLRGCLKKIEARFDYGPRYGSVEWTTLNDVVVALADTEH